MRVGCSADEEFLLRLKIVNFYQVVLITCDINWGLSAGNSSTTWVTTVSSSVWTASEIDLNEFLSGLTWGHLNNEFCYDTNIIYNGIDKLN